MTRLMDIEPVLVTNVIAAVVALLIAFNVPITPEQREAILKLVAAIVAIYGASAAVARSRVYSPSTVRRMMAQMSGDAD